MQLYIAPVQGHTDAAWRHFHAEAYGSQPVYFTPFIRWEKDGIRQRDIRDLTCDLSANHTLVPQVIFRDTQELTSLLDALTAEGAASIDLNMGCPFPLQTARGRGAAAVANAELAKALPDSLARYPGVQFSVKMRLGLESPDEWEALLTVLNDMELHHITLHPRVARQQYGGDLNLDAFRQFMGESKNPVVYNGMLLSPADISSAVETYSNLSSESPSAPLAGVMAGRGLLGRPSLFAEYLEGKEWTREQRLEKMLAFHRSLLNHYEETLCGDGQVLSKIKPFWEYAEAEIGRKPWKAIRKANNMAKYHTAIAAIQ